MIAAMLAGKVHSAAERKVGRESGKAYVRCVIATGTEGDRAWVNVTAFGDEPSEALLRLAVGDSVAVVGTLKVRSWLSKAGEPQAGVDVVANEVMSVYQLSMRRKAAVRPAAQATGGVDAWWDSMPGGGNG